MRVDGAKGAESAGAVDTLALEGISSQSAYESFLSAAKALEPGFIEECCADIVLAYHGVSHAVEQVLGGGAQSVSGLPHVDVGDLSLLPRLVQGLAFAALRVEREREAASFGPLFERVQQVRRRLRKAADAFAEAHLLPDPDIDEVWLHARQDVLEDCLSLVALFRRNAARIAGRSPVTPDEVDAAEQLVGQLRMLLGQPGGAKQEENALVRALEMRDRFWTLLHQRYDVLWRCGAWLYGRAVAERVPPLPVRPALVRRNPSNANDGAAPRVEVAVSRGASTPVLMPVRGGGPSSSQRAPERTSSRHLDELQREMDRKTRFLVRIGALPSSRR
ncbi:hypothetical protein CYFUS_004743 [Cystobacter fuscus]|uniref:Uncharacterized protein n=1 Tax=Cystobacter fuscus TaxID=43 RepID=A0A250J5T6_9BACT|nr:hypothetical protein [Cystobacter fuscus]ATB39299.1 hypothetical protein CYFUS_004743 [Cystobacter fuscus]